MELKAENVKNIRSLAVCKEFLRQAILQNDNQKQKGNEIMDQHKIEVTKVDVYPFKEGMYIGHVKAIANIVLNNQIQVRGLRVMDGECGLFVGYPNDPFYKGDDFRSIVFPLTEELRYHIEKRVLEKYDEATKEAK